MRRVNVMCLAAVLLTAGLAPANTVWNPAANPDPNDIVDGASNWNIAANWTNGMPGDVDQKPVFNGAGAAVACQVTTDTLPFSDSLVTGDGSDFTNIIHVMDGGVIRKTGGGWSGLGYNHDGGTMIVEEGGQVLLESHLWFGMENGGIGRLVINGGYVRVADAVDLGRKAGGNGFLTINDGIFRMRYYPDDFDEPGSLCDVRFGTLVIDNNYATAPSRLWSRINAGTLVGFGGAGQLAVTREPFEGATRTIVRATHPMDPWPGYRDVIPVPSGEIAPVDLVWTNLDPNEPGNPVWVDVWFGTDPNKLSLAYSQEVATGQDVTTVTVNAPVFEGMRPTTYYWQVDSYIYGDPAVVDYDDPETPVIEGDVFRFDVNDDTPPTVAIDTPDTVTWINEPVQLQATITKSGPSEVFIEWTASDPSAVFFPSNTAKDPVVEVDYAAGPVTLTVTVWDAVNPETDSDSMVLHVAADPCAAAALAGIADDYPMNIAGSDCVVDISDLAALVVDWLADYALTEPTVIP
ncbi:MAG TPA: hypothetical protein ENN97_07065 [Phycisphaerales bacterium]|nr:hypothetical protein [Phycisphaerales bacterium]